MTLTMRLAPGLDTYAPARGLREPDLIPTVRVEFCACGEYVRQLAGDTIADTVRRHNDSIPHRSWRLDHGEYPGGVSAPEVENTRRVLDNGGASHPTIEDPTVSLPDSAVAAA